jgi:hypothetical protein
MSGASAGQNEGMPKALCQSGAAEAEAPNRRAVYEGMRLVRLDLAMEPTGILQEAGATLIALHPTHPTAPYR